MLKLEACKPCSLYTLGVSFSQPEGTGRLGVLLIGESLGHEEAIDGLPFRPKAQAGSKLEECIKLAGYTRNDFRLWNIIACQPPGNHLQGQWYEGRAIATCQQYLKKVVNVLQITGEQGKGKRKVILAMGNTAFRTLTANDASVLDIMGYCYPSKLGLFDEIVTVIGTVHPSYIKRGNPHLTPLLVEHIKKAVEIAGQEEDIEWTEDDLKIGGKMERDNNPIPGKDEEDDDIPF